MKSKTLKKIFKHKRSRKNKRSNKNIKRFGKKTRNFRKKYMRGGNDLVSMIQVSAPFAVVAVGNGLLAVGIGAASTLMAPLIVAGGGAAALYAISRESPETAQSLELIAREFLSGARGQNIMSALPWGSVADGVSINPDYVETIARAKPINEIILKIIAAGINAMQSQFGHVGELFQIYVVKNAQRFQTIIAKNLNSPSDKKTLVIVGVMLFALILGCFFKIFYSARKQKSKKEPDITANVAEKKDPILNANPLDQLQDEPEKEEYEEEEQDRRADTRVVNISQPGFTARVNPTSGALAWTIPSTVDDVPLNEKPDESLLPLSELYKLVNEKKEFTTDQRQQNPLFTGICDDLRGQMIKIIHFNANAPELVTIFAHGDETGKILLSIIIKEYYDVDNIMKNPAMFDFYLIQADVPKGFDQNARNLMDSSEIVMHKKKDEDFESTRYDSEWIKSVLNALSTQNPNFNLKCCENTPSVPVKSDNFNFLRRFKIQNVSMKDGITIKGENENAFIDLSGSDYNDTITTLLRSISGTLVQRL